jgi:hypothetical protein
MALVAAPRRLPCLQVENWTPAPSNPAPRVGKPILLFASLGSGKLDAGFPVVELARIDEKAGPGSAGPRSTPLISQPASA